MSKKSSPKAERVVRHKLANGTERIYRYTAYKPKRAKISGDTLGELIAAWERSPEWEALAPSSQANYLTYLKPLMGMQQVQASRIERREIIDIRNALSKAKGNGAAAAFVRTASALFGWAIENGWLKSSPTIRMKRPKGGHLPAWTAQEASLAQQHLSEHLRRAVVLALYTGQRRSDLVRLPWTAYDGKSIRLRQQKTGAALVIPVHPELRNELEAWRTDAATTVILTNKFGRPWREPNLSKQLGDALARIDGFPPHRNIHGLRKLAAANLAQCGCTLHEIGSITGHRSLAMLQLYTQSVEQERLAEAAVLRWTGKKANL